MANDELNSFNDATTSDLLRMLSSYRRNQFGTPNRRKRIPLSGGGDNGEGPGGTGGGGCCCDETDCLTILDYYGNPLTVTPKWYEFYAPSFRCHCVPAADAGAKVKLYPTADPLVWESLPIQCGTGATAGADCTNTATWTWTNGSGTPCSGTCGWNGDGAGGWTNFFDPCNLGIGCSCPEPGFPSTIGGGAPDQQFTACANGVYVPPGWSLTSQTNAGCCTPNPPDFNGTTNGQTATTSCSVTAGDGVLADSIWRLTIEHLGYYGCNDTRLEFLIDGVRVFVHCLTCPVGAKSRPFCPMCVNTFHICGVCGPTRCDVQPPTVICLAPNFGYLVDAVVTCLPSVTHLPRVFRLELNAGTDTSSGAECCSPTNEYEILMEWQPNGIYIGSWHGFTITAPQCCTSSGNRIRSINGARLLCNAGTWQLMIDGVIENDAGCPTNTAVKIWRVTVGLADPFNPGDTMAGDPLDFGVVTDSIPEAPGSYTHACFGHLHPLAYPILP